MSESLFDEAQRKNREELSKKDKKQMFSFFLIILIVVLGFASQPYFEARAFNKFSDIKASYWDAVFTSLRVTSK